MALVCVELQTLVPEPDALTTRPPPCASILGSDAEPIKYLLLNLC